MTLTILTWNTLFAGRDGADDRRAQTQINVISQIRPDVFLMQEAKGFDAGGGALLHALESQIGMRGFLAVATRTGQNVAIFIREPLRPLSFEMDGANFHHALATLKVALPGSGQPLTLISAHLCPNGPAVRRREAAYLAVQAAADSYALLTGDFNSASPHDPEPEGFDVLPAHHRARYLAEDLKGTDRSVLTHLEAAGWIDIGHALVKAVTPTVPAAAFAGTEFATMRCDYVLATAALAAGASRYEVIRTPETDAASDHYPVVATFEVPA
ncbi:endonuclease/exonuclease/phosphatase family protein (plasmid) [Rhizobium sp. SYY.PMSO]